MRTIILRRNPDVIPDELVRILTLALRTETSTGVFGHGLIDPSPSKAQVLVFDSHYLDDNAPDLFISVPMWDPEAAGGGLTIGEKKLGEALQKVVPLMVGDPPRRIITLLEIDRSPTYGSRIWELEAVNKS